MSKTWTIKLTKNAVCNIPLPVIKDAKSVTTGQGKRCDVIVTLVPNGHIGHESKNRGDRDADNNSKEQENLARELHRPNDPSSATRPTRAFDCNLDAMAGFAAAHG